MPHLLETYALNCKAKIDRPEIRESFFPLPVKGKYISLNCEGGMAAKNYLYWNDVVLMIKPRLDAAGISVIQFGNATEKPIAGCVNMLGQTNPNQTAYALKDKNCLLHLGVDSFMVHLADAYDKKIVAIYSISPPEVCGPFFGKKEDHRCITPNFPHGYKYSYNPGETPPRVNTIAPEKIAYETLDALGLDPSGLPKTLHMGERYHMQILECVPDQVVSAEAFPGMMLHIRHDYATDPQAEQILYNQLSVRKCSVVIDRPLNLDVLKKLRANIDKIAYEIKDGNSADFLKQLQRAAIPFLMVSHMTKEEIVKVKLTYADYGIIFRQDKKAKSDCKNSDAITRESMFKTNKFLLSKQKIYTSKYDWINQKPIRSFQENISTLGERDDEFWREQDFFYIFNQ